MDKVIVHILRNLNEIEGITVEVAADGTVGVYPDNKKNYVLRFRLIWYRDHFTGYVDYGNGKMSPAVISLWNANDAFKFASAYFALKDIWAKKQ